MHMYEDVGLKILITDRYYCLCNYCIDRWNSRKKKQKCMLQVHPSTIFSAEKIVRIITFLPSWPILLHFFTKLKLLPLAKIVINRTSVLCMN